MWLTQSNRKLRNQRFLSEKNGCSFHQLQLAFSQVRLLVFLFNFYLSLKPIDLDPTKLKARQFSRGTAPASTSKNDTSLWTETPAERQQRLADEVSGKKRRVTDAPVDEDEDAKAKKRRRKAEEGLIRRGVEEHTVCFYHIACQMNYIDFLTSSVNNAVQLWLTNMLLSLKSQKLKYLASGTTLATWVSVAD